MNTAFMLPFVWPLCFVLVALFFIRQIGPDARLLAIWAGKTFSTQASKHLAFIAVMLGMGMQAFGTGFYDNFWPIEPPDMAKLGWWQVIAAFLKSCSFAVGIMVGFAIRASNPPAAAPAEAKPAAPAPVTPP